MAKITSQTSWYQKEKHEASAFSKPHFETKMKWLFSSFPGNTPDENFVFIKHDLSSCITKVYPYIKKKL